MSLLKKAEGLSAHQWDLKEKENSWHTVRPK